jgi:exodeoxyribonuclease VIII
MTNVMIDLETLGMTPGCQILSIGAVHFSADGLGQEFYAVVNTASCQSAGLLTDQSTVDWWSRQAEEAKKVIDEAVQSPITLAQALGDFKSYLSFWGLSKVKVWGNGSDFDNAIMACCYKALGSDLPWKFWNNRCYRTLKGLRPAVQYDRKGTYHNALDDAKTQALHAIEIFREIKSS